MNVQINYLAVLLAAVSSMVVGSVWYAKGVFGATWMKLVNLDEKKARQQAPIALVVAFLSSLLMAYVLAHVAYISNSFFKDSFLVDALSTGLWLWLGIFAVRIVMHDTFEQRSSTITWLTIGNEFVTIMVMALVIGLLKP